VNRDPAAQLSGFSDHALPWQLIARLACLERCSGDARAAGNAGELGDLAVRCYLAARDLADDGMDAAIQLAQMIRVVGHATLPG
jgi:hypothetical protein